MVDASGEADCGVGSDSDPGRLAGGAGFPRVLSLLIFTVLSMLWLAHYPSRDADDKAVHYYSAARLYASGDKVAAVDQAVPGWVARLDPASARHPPRRLTNRLSSYANYLVPSTLVRIFAEITRPPDGPPESYTRPVRRALLASHMLALVWLAAVTWRNPWTMLLFYSCILAAASGLLMRGVAGPSSWKITVLVYAPRGAEVILCMAALAALLHQRWLMAGITLVLMLGWHAGIAAMTIPVILGTLGLALAAERISGKISRRSLIASMLAIGGLVLWLMPVPGSAGRVGIPLLTFVVLVIIHRPWSDSRWAASTLASAYLMLAQTVTVMFSTPGVCSWVMALTGNHLVVEVPDRLAGSKQLASILLLLSVILWGLDYSMKRMKRAVWSPVVHRVVFLGIFICGTVVVRAPLQKVVTGEVPFFRRDEERVVRQFVKDVRLGDLDPLDEPEFFATIGDFLIVPTQDPGVSQATESGAIDAR